MRHDAVAVEFLARARWGEPNRALSTRSELRFGRHGSVSVAVAGEKAGLWYDHEAGRGGRLRAEGDASPAPARPAAAARERYGHDAECEAAVRRILDACGDPLGTPAEAYLRSRAIEPPYPRCVRFCARPLGMAVLAQDGGGAVRAVQVVHLTPAGMKADVPVVKRSWKAGHHWNTIAAVRYPGRGTLILCEGPETGLSVWRATGRPVWCCLSSGNIGRIGVWPRRRVTLARDGDKPGSKADEAFAKARAALEARGVEVRVARPPTGLDWNDVHRRDGLDAVARAFARGR